MNRRYFLRGALAIPAIVLATSIMPVRSIERFLQRPMMRLRRGNDDMEANIFRAAAGGLDMGAIERFLGNSSGYVCAIYSQAIGGNDLRCMGEIIRNRH